MRSGREPGLAHIADDLTLRDLHSRLDAIGERLQVAVASDDALRMANLDEVPVAATPLAADDHSRTCSHDRSAEISRVVGPFDAFATSRESGGVGRN